MGVAIDSIVCNGTIVSGARVQQSILGPSVRVNSYAHVSESILFEGVQVGRHAKIRRAIIDKHVQIPPGFEIGYDLEKDRARGFTISPGGIVTIAKTEDLSGVSLSENLTSVLAEGGVRQPYLHRPNSGISSGVGNRSQDST
jgi:glucose-1-phosphate adenylyltransferase